MLILVSTHTCITILAYNLSPMSPMRGFRNDTDFTRCHMLEPAQVIYSSHERIAFAKMMAKPPHQDHNTGHGRA